MNDLSLREVADDMSSENSNDTAGDNAGSDGVSAPRKPWNAFATPVIGKAVRGVSRLLHHGGSAFPGKVVEKIDPDFLARTLARLPYGVILVSGTNGKTTTTRMIASMLRNLEFKVFTNPTGSNFTRGVVSAILSEISASGEFDADIAVLELDEAYAVHFVRQVKPRYALLLNVMRDQLDRFGEIDNTAQMLGKVAEATTDTVILNREDRRVAALNTAVPEGTHVRYFGLADNLRKLFPSDDDMHADDLGNGSAKATSAGIGGTDGDGGHTSVRTAQSTNAVEDGPRIGAKPMAAAPDPKESVLDSSAMEDSAQIQCPADVVLNYVGDHEAAFVMDDAEFETNVQLEGAYNLFNAAAALAVVRCVTDHIDAADVMTLPRARDERLMQALSHVTPAFGRGEVINVGDAPVELLLVKNPMGFRMSLASFAPEGCDTMIVINDEYADGRDMSWLWDVDFTSLRATGVKMVSGVRAWDMALRLGYEGVNVVRTDTNLEAAVREFVTADQGVPKHIYCTYTAMLKVRSELGKYAQVSDAGVGK
ncbi:UDP-N-acetylmuramyl tripeptide synthase [Bifidobacterium commune]|uniref:Lipid II isoglutaminyl synthase (glutamine-hydrolyzing) subunit MurT n=1 Tax=Bifidobacterium commune TaxID=1505727 RepID=A0A1C4H6K6_9BIFI|nr:Mur ligase family protein [Bifidobacterium commune]MBB2955566.1 UDP-N-acetylmuramyl tripeptide synthase [Bifidobacterium commune]SCC80624.1 UDP-N-acetylmuramyl tripeptide synthase [Bifidobacterium commune]